MNFKQASQQLPSIGVLRFIVGLIAFFIGVIAKHPLLALAILACAVVLPAWKYAQAMRLEREQRKAKLIADATVLARQRQNQRLHATSPPPIAQTLPPPLPAQANAVENAKNPATPFEFEVPSAPLPQAATTPTLDWQPSSGFTPPSVMPKSAAFAPPYGASMALDCIDLDKQRPADAISENQELSESDDASSFHIAADLSGPDGFKRVDLGSRDGYQLVKVVHSNNPSEVLRFELLRGLEVICSGTQAQVKAALQAVLRGA
jgi:hypothetical protein